MRSVFRHAQPVHRTCCVILEGISSPCVTLKSVHVLSCTDLKSRSHRPSGVNAITVSPGCANAFPADHVKHLHSLLLHIQPLSSWAASKGRLVSLCQCLCRQLQAEPSLACQARALVVLAWQASTTKALGALSVGSLPALSPCPSLAATRTPSHPTGTHHANAGAPSSA